VGKLDCMKLTLALAAAFLFVLPAPFSALAADANVPESLPVSFRVANVNGSELACAADGEPYTVRGRIVGPRALLQSGRPGLLATLYLHEYSFGRFFWSFPDPAFDYAAEQARAGHVSVVIDRLGYDDSDHPAGNDTCLGAHADIARQVIGQLRSGQFEAGGRSLRFPRLVLAGHSVGAAIAELAAYSFEDLGIEGLVNFSWADQGVSQRTFQQSAAQGAVCARGGEASEPDGAGGYAYFGQTEEDFQDNVFRSASPSVVALATAMRNRDPCGDSASLTQATILNNRMISRITAPVLLLFGRDDPVFEPGAPDDQVALYSGSPDVTLEKFDDTSHALTLERSAPKVRLTVSDWLTRRGLVSAAATTDGGEAGPDSADRLRLTVTPRSVRAGRRTRFGFRVTVAGGHPVRGATVRFAGASVRTNAEGRAAIVRTLGRAGSYRARASKSGTREGSVNVRALRRRGGRGRDGAGRGAPCDSQRGRNDVRQQCRRVSDR